MASRALRAGLSGAALSLACPVLLAAAPAAPQGGDEGGVIPIQPVHVLLELDGPAGNNALSFVQTLPLASFDLDLNYDAISVVEEDPSNTGLDGSSDDASTTGVMPVGVPAPPAPPTTGTGFVPKVTHIVRGTVEPQDIPLIEALPEIVAVWDDAGVEHYGPASPPLPLGDPPPHPCVPFPMQVPPTVAQVRETLKTLNLGRFGGEGVVIGVVDGGIDAPALLTQVDQQLGITQDPVIGGWPSDWGTKAQKWAYHGNMSAFDALVTAPKAKLYDLRISDNDSPFLNPNRALISDALAAYDWAIRQHVMTGKPDILTNSWGIFDKDNAPNYATDRNHPFTRKVVQALDVGMIVLFAAGNCGGDPSFPFQSACGPYIGHGQDIWGANGHPRVMTVGAATTDSELLCFSSRGPAALHDEKPDFLSVSHFLGFYSGFSQSNFADSGTSAACALTAGILATLLEADPLAGQEDLRWALRIKADVLGTPYNPVHTRVPAYGVIGKWNPDSGSGLVRVKDSLDYLTSELPVDSSSSTGQKVNQ